MAGDEIPVEVEQVDDPAQTWQQILEETRARVNEAKSNIAAQLLKAAETIRRQTQASGDEDAIMQADKVARSLERAGLFLDSHSVEEVGGEVAQAMSSLPLSAVVAAFIVGLAIGLFFGRR